MSLASMSNQTTDAELGDDFFVFEDYTQRTILAVISSVVFVVGITGNTLVFLAVTLSRSLRSPTNWFVVNLAFADISTCLCLPFQILATMSTRGWLLPGWICSVAGGVIFMSAGCSIVNLALIAYNRWYLLTRSNEAFRKLYKTKKIIAMMAFAWFYGFLINIFPTLVGIGRLGYSDNYKTCTDDITAPTARYYGTIQGVGMFVLPSIVIVTCYISIYRFIIRHDRMMKSVTRKVDVRLNESEAHTSPTVTSFVSSSYADTSDPLTEPKRPATLQIQDSPPPANHQDIVLASLDPDAEVKRPPEIKKASSELKRRQNAITKRMGVIACAFFACYLPCAICSSLSGSLTDPALPWAQLLVITNSCLNPLLYARTMPSFRRVMACIMRCRFGAIPEPIAFLRRRAVK